MYWADLTKKMLVHFKQSDEALKDSVLCRKKGVYEEIVFKEEVKVEEVAEPEVKQLDLAAMLKKKAAAATAMKGTKGKKNKYGKPVQVEFAPKAAEAAKKPEPIKVEIEELSREDRQKVD